MNLDLFTHFYFVLTASSLVVGLLVALVIFRTNQGRAKNYLAAVISCMALSVGANAYLHFYLTQQQMTLLGFPEPFQLLFGPMVFLYLQALGRQPVSNRIKTLLLVPFFVFTLVFVVFLSWSGMRTAFGSTFYYTIGSISLLAYLLLWFYYWLCHRALKAYREQLKLSCSNLAKINQAWVEYSLFVLLICYAGFTVLYLLNHGNFSLPVNKSLAIIVSFLVFVIVYRTLCQPEMIAGPLNLAASVSKKSETKYVKSGLAVEDAQQLLETVKQHMSNNQPFIDPTLSLQSLADQLELSPQHLSQVLNHDNKSSFYDFVNSYRVEAFIEQLRKSSNQQTTIISLAYDVGFNSKATFNRIFKKATQQTPSEFRKSLS